MGRALIVIHSDADRERATDWIWTAPLRTRVEFKTEKRSIPQNDRMWAMLTDVATQTTHHGRRYKPGQWKVLFMHACGREVQFIPALDGSTFLPWGGSSSELSKEEMTELMDFISAWGVQHGVVFNDPMESAA